MSLEWRARSNPLALWWGLLALVSSANIAFWFLLYLTSAFLPWLAFAECVSRGCNAFSENAAYLKKLPIPEQVFVAQTAASATLGLVISFSLLLVISLALGLRPSLHWLLLPYKARRRRHWVGANNVWHCSPQPPWVSPMTPPGCYGSEAIWTMCSRHASTS